MKSAVSCGGLAWRAGVAVCSALLYLSNPGFGGQTEESVEELADKSEAAAEALSKKRIFFMPIPITNPTIGTGLGVSTMYLFQAGENAPPSNLMLAGFWADSNSWAGGAGTRIHFKDDIYRLSGWAGYFDVNLKFFGIGNEAGDRGQWVTINQRGPFLTPQLLRRVAGNFYLGAKLRFLRVTTAFEDLPDWLPGDILREGIEIASSGLGLVVEHDSRDNEFNPFTGSHFELTSVFAREALGADRNYELYEAGYNLYREVGDRKVLA